MHWLEHVFVFLEKLYSSISALKRKLKEVGTNAQWNGKKSACLQ
jgi:hypothetical protein